jgi:EAL domain-containing protein (putative c-di-GMP-specific phosphodiesterase class I)
VDAVKIDRSFTAGLGQGQRDTAIVAAIISIAHSLQLQVIAEGITREGQVERLLRMGCRRGQGFLFSRPVEASEIEALLAAAAVEPPPRLPARA